MIELLKAENLGFNVENQGLFSRSNNEKTILKNISFSLEKGNILGIAGESGSGKTTLAKILTGIIPNTSGNLEFNRPPEWKNCKVNPVQILFQNNGEILNPFREIDSIVEEAIYIKTGSKKNIYEEKKRIFESVNFPESLWLRKGFELSGGEQQRAALARIIAVKPELLILDEPFSAQDAVSQLNLLTLFKEINKTFGITMICISHNISILRKLCNKIMIMYKGGVVEMGKTEDVFNHAEHPYTKFLIKAEGYQFSYDELKSEFENIG